MIDDRNLARGNGWQHAYTRLSTKWCIGHVYMKPWRIWTVETSSGIPELFIQESTPRLWSFLNVVWNRPVCCLAFRVNSVSSPALTSPIEHFFVIFGHFGNGYEWFIGQLLLWSMDILKKRIMLIKWFLIGQFIYIIYIYINSLIC